MFLQKLQVNFIAAAFGNVAAAFSEDPWATQKNANHHLKMQLQSIWSWIWKVVLLKTIYFLQKLKVNCIAAAFWTRCSCIFWRPRGNTKKCKSPPKNAAALHLELDLKGGVAKNNLFFAKAEGKLHCSCILDTVQLHLLKTQGKHKKMQITT